MLGSQILCKCDLLRILIRVFNEVFSATQIIILASVFAEIVAR